MLEHRYLSLAIFLLMCFAWAAVSNLGLVGKTLIATPQEVFDVTKFAFSEQAKLSDKFHIHAAETIQRAITGWGISLFLGVFFGVIIGSFYKVYVSSEIMTEFVRAIPPVLAFPLLLVAFNFDEPSYIWTIFFGAFPVMLITVAKSVVQLSKSKLEIIEIFKVDLRISYFIKFMEILPSIFLGARLTLATSLTIAVVTEMIFTPRNGLSLGALARDSEIDFNTPMFYTCIITIGLFGYLANMLLRRAEEVISPAESNR